MELLKNKNALVTGANQGIGAGIAYQLAEAGANVAINYYSEKQKQESESLALKLKENFDISAIAIQGDVTKKAEILKLVSKTIDTFGTIDILINNAGIAPFVSFFDLTEEIWDETYNTNVKSIFLLSQEVAKYMIKNGEGKIINVTSTASLLVTSPVIPHYISSKAAAAQLTKALAIELGPYNINVNAIGPSTTATDMTEDMLKNETSLQKEINANPMKRLGTPKQIGDTAVFLSSEGAKQINGQVIMVDGGLTVKAAQPDSDLS